MTAVLRSAGRPDITLESPTFNPGISPSIEWIPFRELLPDTDYDLRVSAWCHDGTSDQEERRLHVTAAQPEPTTTGTLSETTGPSGEIVLVPSADLEPFLAVAEFSVYANRQVVARTSSSPPRLLVADVRDAVCSTEATAGVASVATDLEATAIVGNKWTLTPALSTITFDCSGYEYHPDDESDPGPPPCSVSGVGRHTTAPATCALGVIAFLLGRRRRRSARVQAD